MQQILVLNFSGIEFRQVFKLYMTVKKACIMCYKDSFKPEETEELRQTISNMFRLAREINPNFRITPKMHHMTHYHQIIEKFGTLIDFSTLPYERKHFYFKRWARVMCNHKNPAKSLAERHQYSMAVDFDQKDYEATEFRFTNEIPIELRGIREVLVNKRIVFANDRPFKLGKGKLIFIKLLMY